MALDIAVILGTVRDDRLGIRVARYAMDQIRQRGHTGTLIDPLTMELPLLNKVFSEYEKGEAPAAMEQISGILEKADAYIVVSAEYNHSIPPAMSNTLDHFMKEYFFKPAGIFCYSVGAFGGMRAAMQLRALLPEVGAITIPSILPFPKAGEILDEQGQPTGTKPGSTLEKFFQELEWYGNAMQVARAQGTPY